MDKNVAISLKVVGFLLILTSAWVPIYVISFDSTPTDIAIIPENPTEIYSNNGTLSLPVAS